MLVSPPQERNAAEPAGKPWNPATGSPPLIFMGGPTATSNPGARAALACLHGCPARPAAPLR